jgi:hypothetical protein
MKKEEIVKKIKKVIEILEGRADPYTTMEERQIQVHDICIEIVGGEKWLKDGFAQYNMVPGKLYRTGGRKR